MILLCVVIENESLTLRCYWNNCYAVSDGHDWTQNSGVGMQSSRDGSISLGVSKGASTASDGGKNLHVHSH